MTVRVGTSGWAYPHWRGRFYPAALPEADWLSHYTRSFDSVELNSSFYRLPTRDQFAAWREGTPPGFVFAVKASRFITHMKKLLDPDLTLPPLLEAVAGLGDRLGPLLFQLPPRWHVNLDRLQSFLQVLPRNIRCAFEFRDPSWHCREVAERLAKFNAAFCIYDIGGFTSPRWVTTDFVYLRLHGPGAPYCGGYGEAALQEWAEWLDGQGVADAYAYFDNDEAAYAVENARRLQVLVRPGAGSHPG